LFADNPRTVLTEQAERGSKKSFKLGQHLLTPLQFSRQNLEDYEPGVLQQRSGILNKFPKSSEEKNQREDTSMLLDLRFALRMLMKQPGFSLIAILTLALGIGATSAVLSLIQGVLLTPPPYRQPQELVLVPPARADGQKMDSPRGWPAEQWMEWQREAKSFQGIAAYNWTFNFLIRGDGSQSMQGMVVTKDYLPVMGLKTVVGRGFEDGDFKQGPTQVIVLGYDFWQRVFAGDTQIVGKTVRISRWDVPPVVIGVMQPGVRFLPSPGASKEPNYNVNATVDFWLPGVPDPKELKGAYWNLVGRVRGGITPQHAQEELTVLAQREAQSEPQFRGFVPQLEPLTEEMNRDGQRILLPLLGAALLVLLIACGNAAALLLVRGLQRQQEYAVRSAMGMGRIALLRQALIESLVLALTGGVFGVGLAFAVVKLFKLIAGHAVPRLDGVTAGWAVLAWGLGAAVVASFLAGVFPALRAFRLDPMTVLKNAGPKGTTGTGERQLLRGVTMVQTALTLALLVGAGLLIRTMMNIAKVPSGYNTGRILTMSVTEVQSWDTWGSFHRQALERVSALPGVQYAAFAWGVPLTGNYWPATLEIEGQPPAIKESDKTTVPMRAVTPDYFKLMGMALMEGREFRLTDDNKAPNVAIVNQSFASRYFPHENAIGRKFWFNGRDKPGIEIVGEISSGRTDDLTQEASPEIYLPLWQATAFSKHLVVRTTADPSALVVAVERELHAIDPTAAVENVRTLEQIRDDSLASRTFAMQLLVGFSLVGSALTLVGVYGVLSLSVASRSRELAIRSAVGAQQKDIRNLIFGEGFRLIIGGVLAGVVLAIVLSRVLSSFLFEVQPNDPATLIIVGALFMGVALLACWVPVHRAARIDSLEALRYE
jgi:putative ABC transport system permease protein